ncbi:hypothetical protein AB0E25_01935 [Streptomyces bobili]|uniref:hypothetical protein n=1 Tax=Streptomyces bobili TaxID=67280 RepID=UPI0033EBB1C6
MSAATGEVYRIAWLPGTDVLHGTCHCGAAHAAQDPVQMWEWMLGHPEGHRPPSPAENPGHTGNTGNTGNTEGSLGDDSTGNTGNGSDGRAA